MLVNQECRANGRWRFTVCRLIAERNTVVCEVAVTDGVISAIAITISTIDGPGIVQQIEYWPDSYEPPEWRAELVEQY